MGVYVWEADLNQASTSARIIESVRTAAELRRSESQTSRPLVK